MKNSTVADPRNPFDKDALARQRQRGLSTPDERAAVSTEIETLHRDGFLILEHVLTPDQVGEIATELERIHQTTPLGTTDFEGFHSKRIYALMAKIRAVDALCAHPRMIAIAEGYLQDQILLNSSTAITLLPGETAQGLHRDDSCYPIPRPHAPLMLSTLWAIDPFTAENGGTLFVPGSHTAVSDDRPTQSPSHAEMPAGSVLIYDGALWHCGGANRSSGQRAAISLAYIRAWLRQQENQYLSVPLETVRTLSRPMQCLLGYTTASLMLGQVERRNPIHWFDEPG